jgi:TIR domain-containing protein
MRAFLSYQTADRHVAAEVRAFLDELGISAFMAHNDIQVSHEWQEVILAELARTDLFIAILSKNYYASHYCLQESGIAIFRKIVIMPLSTDGSIPPGFMAHLQSRRIEAGKVSHAVLFAGIAKYDCTFAVDRIINRLGASRSYASAEANFAMLNPYIEEASEKQIVDVLMTARNNSQVAYSFGCRPTLCELLGSHGRLLKKEDRSYLDNVLNS